MRRHVTFLFHFCGYASTMLSSLSVSKTKTHSRFGTFFCSVTVRIMKMAPAQVVEKCSRQQQSFSGLQSPRWSFSTKVITIENRNFFPLFAQEEVRASYTGHFCFEQDFEWKFLFIQQRICLIPNDDFLCLSLVLPTTASANIFSFNSSHLFL